MAGGGGRVSHSGCIISCPGQFQVQPGVRSYPEDLTVELNMPATGAGSVRGRQKGMQECNPNMSLSMPFPNLQL